MEQLSSFMVLDVNGGTRVSYTYDVINDENGKLISANNKDGFYALNPELKAHIEAIRDYIRTNELGG